jgi:DNA-binding transcriptional MerR regulator
VVANSGSGLTVGQVAGLSGVTVRTLHHYEQIGLLVPGGRTAAGYRVYSDADIDRLSRVLYYRELGFPLEQISTMLDDAGTGDFGHLERQHSLLQERLHRLEAMVAALEREMEARMGGYNLTPAEKLEVFGDFDPAQYEDEARERWGETDAWKQSQERTKRYTKDDWKAIQAEAGDISQRFIAAMKAGVSAANDEAMAIAEEHRQHMNRWFYDCSHEFHRCLAEIYVSDPRFTENIDKDAPGLAAYTRDAIIANADRAGG